MLLLCQCCYVHWKSPLRISKALLKLLALQLPTLLLRLFQLPHLHENVYLPHSSCNATSVWTILGRCTQFLVSSLWLLIPTPTATFQLGQHKYLWSCAENRIGELIKLKITFFFPKSFFRQSSSWCSSFAVGWWKAGVLQDQEVGLGELDAFLPPQCLVMLA